MAIPVLPNLYEALKAEGFELPPNCGDVMLEMPVDGAFVLVYRRIVDKEELAKVAKALLRISYRQ